MTATPQLLTPVVREILADLDTPLSTFLKLADQPNTYLFESVQGGEKWGRYSIIGLPCRETIRFYDHRLEHRRHGELIANEEIANPLDWIEQFQKSFQVVDVQGLPRFTGGLVGYFGYETIRYIEPRLAKKSLKPDEIKTPDILLMVSDEVVVFDNLAGRLYLIVYVPESEKQRGEQRLDELAEMLKQPFAEPELSVKEKTIKESDFVSGFTEEGYKQGVEKSREYIKDGDVMQVVLSQRMTIDYQAPPLNLYRALRSLNPSPYMFYLDFGDFHVVGSSPEILVRLEDDEVTVRPLAGTRPRGKTAAEDAALEKELLADPKERAEHLMLIDLGRNDAGRVAQTGSVEVTDEFVVERYSHVMHIVSNVRGKIKPELTAMDVLKATFPAGTLSGAPKIRAMEIIDELEPVKRGVYSGAVGYIGWNNNLDMAIAIRTAVIKDNKLHIQAGAGLVYDSVPQNEWDETQNKARAVFRAVAMAERGLSVM